MLYLKAFILALIQALTEFIPVSSSGHLIVFGNYLNFNGVDGELFQIAIQLASTLAVVIYFRKKLFSVAFSLHKNENSRNFAYKFIIAFLPCALVGLFGYKYIKTYLHTDLVVAVSLILGGIVFLIIDRKNIKPVYTNVDNVSKIASLKVGIAQIFSMIPGVSRSGSTIVGGLLSKLSRRTAVEFSFILAIPTILAATVFDLYKNLGNFNGDNICIIAFGFIVTFAVSMATIRWFLNYVSEHNFNLFGYYRIFLGVVIILIKYLFF